MRSITFGFLCRQVNGWCGALLLALILLPSGRVSAQTAQKLLGVHTANLNALRGEPSRITPLQQVGPKVIRLPVTWHLMEERGAGITDAWFWSELDAEVAAAGTLGAKLIITFSQTPCWASADPKKNCPQQQWDVLYRPTQASAYAKALGRLAARYKGKVYAYEIWNEPNLVWFWKGVASRTPTNDPYGSFVGLTGADQYAQLVVAAYPVVKAADPAAMVLAGSIAGGDVEYFNRLFNNASFKNAFDALSMHPYTSEYPGTNPTGARFGPSECPAGSMVYWCAGRSVDTIRAAMVSRGLSARNIWFTEFGFSSSHYWNGSNSLTGTVLSEQGQAAYLTEMVGLIRNWSFVPVAVWYNLIDAQPHEPRYGDGSNDEREAHYGLFYAGTATLKPSGTAFKAAVADLSAVKATLQAPLGNSTVNPPVFRWSAVPGAQSYRLYVNEYATPNVPGKLNLVYTAAQAGCSTGVTCSVSPGVAFAAAPGAWWITPSMSGGVAGAVSDTGNFTLTTTALATVPVIVSPNGGSSGTRTPAYVWKPVTGSTSYKIWLNNYASTGVDYNGRVNATLTPAQAACSSTQCSYRPATSLYAGTASWWVTSVRGSTQTTSVQANFSVP